MCMRDHNIGMVGHDPVYLYSFETDFEYWNLKVILAKKYDLVPSFNLGT